MLIGTGIASIIHNANIETTKSGELSLRIATKSPGAIPDFLKCFAAKLTLKFND